MKKHLISTICYAAFAMTGFAQTWTPQTSGTNNDLWGVSFTDACTDGAPVRPERSCTQQMAEQAGHLKQAVFRVFCAALKCLTP